MYLLASSFILLFLQMGGVTIEKIGVLGVTFAFENINAIYWALWALLFYSFLRYWQYFNTQSTGGGLIQPYKDHREIIFKKRIKKLIDKRIPEGSTLELHQPFTYPYFNHFEKISKFRYKTKVSYAQEDGNGKIVQHMNYEIQFHLIRDFGFTYLKLWVLFLLNRPAVFEFVFPMLLATFTIIYCNLKEWPGALSILFSTSSGG